MYNLVKAFPHWQPSEWANMTDGFLAFLLFKGLEPKRTFKSVQEMLAAYAESKKAEG